MPAALRAHLLADADIHAKSGGRISWGLRPQARALPALVLSAVGGSIATLVDGEPGLRRTSVQADSFASSHAEAWALSEAVLAAVAAPIERDGVRLQSAGHSAARSLPETAPDGGSLFRVSVDLDFWHT